MSSISRRANLSASRIFCIGEQICDRGTRCQAPPWPSYSRYRPSLLAEEAHRLARSLDGPGWRTLPFKPSLLACRLVTSREHFHAQASSLVLDLRPHRPSNYGPGREDGHRPGTAAASWQAPRPLRRSTRFAAETSCRGRKRRRSSLGSRRGHHRDWSRCRLRCHPA